MSEKESKISLMTRTVFIPSARLTIDGDLADSSTQIRWAIFGFYRLLAPRPARRDPWERI